MGNVPANHTVWAADNGTWQNDLPLAASFISFASFFIALAVVDMCLFFVCIGNEWRQAAGCIYAILELIMWIVAFSLFIAYFETGNKASKAYIHDGCADIALRGCNMSARVVIVGSLFFFITLFTLVYRRFMFFDDADRNDVSTADAIRGLSCFGCCNDREESGSHKKNDEESQSFVSSGASTIYPSDIDEEIERYKAAEDAFTRLNRREPSANEKAWLMQKYGSKN